MKLVFTPEAERQAAEMDTWWREHRHAARDLFARELAEATRRIVVLPSAGVTYCCRSNCLMASRTAWLVSTTRVRERRAAA